MKFNIINKEIWNRKEYFKTYYKDIPCTYSMTVELNINNFINILKNKNLKFFPSILFAISVIVNDNKEFRMDINSQGEVGYYDFLNPSYTILNKEEETFSSIWTKYSPEYMDFYNNCLKDMEKYKNPVGLFAKPLEEKNIFNVSSIPWVSFKGFDLNLQKGYGYLLPIFTLGKYFLKDNEYYLPVSITVHHAVCDGYHLSKFIKQLQNLLDNFK